MDSYIVYWVYACATPLFVQLTGVRVIATNSGDPGYRARFQDYPGHSRILGNYGIAGSFKQMVGVILFDGRGTTLGN